MTQRPCWSTPEPTLEPTESLNSQRWAKAAAWANWGGNYELAV